MNKQLIAMLCFLSFTIGAYGSETQGDCQEKDLATAQNVELTIEFQKIVEIMLERGLIVPNVEGDGIKPSDKGQTIIDLLRDEGRIELNSVDSKSICW